MRSISCCAAWQRTGCEWRNVEPASCVPCVVHLPLHSSSTPLPQGEVEINLEEARGPIREWIAQEPVSCWTTRSAGAGACRLCTSSSQRQWPFLCRAAAAAACSNTPCR